MNKVKLSVVQATKNEEANIARNLSAVKDIAGEMIVVDEYSTDKTREIAEKLGAKVYLEPHHEIFHITKQKAMDLAKGEWILQMDTDEVVTPELAKEIIEVINMTNEEILNRKPKNQKLKSLFDRHQKIIEERDGKIGNDSNEVVAFFIPRKNMFLGEPLIHAGVYPDPAIRLIKKGKAYLPCKSVHEIMKVEGRIEWLYNDMEHYDSPTLKRYFMRLNRYTNLQAEELKTKKVSKGVVGFLQYTIYYPLFTFFNMYLRHKGFLDGVNGFLWCLFSSWHFPIAYFKYITMNLN
jgi:glycosyltransferase involved in cell wall biosynthesis